MKSYFINLLAGVMLLIGTIFSLQGAGILLGSFMTGDPFWLFVGIVLILLAIGLFLYQRRQKAKN